MPKIWMQSSWLLSGLGVNEIILAVQIQATRAACFRSVGYTILDRAIILVTLSYISLE